MDRRERLSRLPCKPCRRGMDFGRARNCAERFVQLPRADDGFQPPLRFSFQPRLTPSDRRLQEGLQEVKAPKLAINSRPTHMEAAQRHGIEVVLMSGVGHFVMLEDPQTFNRLLDEAVKKFIHARALQEEPQIKVRRA
jgi:pimeloyl-ACP methyl ester carboxylesterase